MFVCVFSGVVRVLWSLYLYVFSGVLCFLGFCVCMCFLIFCAGDHGLLRCVFPGVRCVSCACFVRFCACFSKCVCVLFVFCAGFYWCSFVHVFRTSYAQWIRGFTVCAFSEVLSLCVFRGVRLRVFSRVRKRLDP